MKGLLTNKKALIALTLALGVGGYFLFRKRQLRFFDNVWCQGENCGNIEDAIAYCSGGRQRPSSRDINVEFENLPIEVQEAATIKDDELSCDLIPSSLEGGRSGDGLTEDEFIGQGYLNFIFPEPHGLKVGDIIYVTQDADFTFEYYNGRAEVLKVINPYIIRTNKAFKGASPIKGGEIVVESIFNKWFGI